MICKRCRSNEHGECRGPSWCDCQHRSDRKAAESLLASRAVDLDKAIERLPVDEACA